MTISTSSEERTETTATQVVASNEKDSSRPSGSAEPVHPTHAAVVLEPVENDFVKTDDHEEGHDDDDDDKGNEGEKSFLSSDSSSSPSSSSSSSSPSYSSSSSLEGSLDLNPNSTIDNADLTGIALLKEIFPEETTQSLRELHYQHIMSHRMMSPSVNGDSDEDNDGGRAQEMGYQNGNNKTMDHRRCASKSPPALMGAKQRLFPVVQLPDDFLRLPMSVAVLRADNNHDGIHKYEFLSDLQQQVLNEYSLAVGAVAGGEDEFHEQNVEILSIAVKKHDRWGLGMTLQEEEAVIRKRLSKGSPLTRSVQPCDDVAPLRFGLQVVGFLPDLNKIKRGEIKSDISMSPAQEAGVEVGDLLIGINGSAFMLPRFSSLLYARGGDYDHHYKSEKAKIVDSIQKSPDPIVLHVRRRRQRYADSKSSPKWHGASNSPAAIERSTSLLDTTVHDEENDLPINQSLTCFRTPPIKQQRPQHQQLRSVPSASSSLSTASSIETTKTPTSFKSPSVVPPPPPTPPPSNQFTKHPLSHALTERKLIRSGDDQWRITYRLQQFTDRTRQWESSSALRLKVESASNNVQSSAAKLLPYFDPKDLPPEMAALIVYSLQEQQPEPMTDGRQQQQQISSFYTPSTPSLPHDSPLIPIEYLQAFYGEEQARQIVSLRLHHQSRHSSISPNKALALSEEYPGQRLLQRRQTWKGPSATNQKFSDEENSMVWVPLHGIRKSLSARIVNSFVEEGSESDKSNGAVQPRMAYTVWVYDVESGNEWYAPIRYWKDFCDLRDVALTLLPPTSNTYKELSNMKFPKEPSIPTNGPAWGPAVGSAVFGSRYSKRLSPLSPLQQKRRQRQDEEFEESRLQTCRVLEEMIRELLGVVYTCQPLQPSIAEIALYVQSFLGVDGGMTECPVSFVPQEQQTRQMLKRSIQRYTWRVFLLHSMKAIVRDFVDAARARGPKLHDIEVLEAQGRSALKTRATEELGKVQTFLDHLVDLIIDGCDDDLKGIAKRHEYSAVRLSMNDQAFWDRLVREAVREQVEIEVYVPLRSVVSRLLVNGWRHEDIESNFKIKELRKRPQRLFRIPNNNISQSNWQSVADILKNGVGMSTLPCVKLRAIVEAAREISRLHDKEHDKEVILGADDFLPIFIFSVVQAEMERPCALCILLRTLCDKNNRIGELGYFLASFEAAITHIQEIDLTEDREEMLSFSTTPLTDVSLGD